MGNFNLINALIDLAILFLIGYAIFKIVKKIKGFSNKKMNELEKRISDLEKK
ncbi:hypothetical protein [Bacillus sp. OAE603]|uniref:hypothetical protein n=1 Tax=Gottfriedia sp. OAE603 TaxID=2663872 RepID=UPI00178C15F6